MSTLHIKRKTKEFHTDDIGQDVKENKKFRSIQYTDKNLQIVYMTLEPGKEIGTEIHPTQTQFFRVEYGYGVYILDGQEHVIKKESAFVIPFGKEHNVINKSKTRKLQLYTIYGPPVH